MASRTPQRTVYLVTAVIVASMVGGFALAEMALPGGVNQSYQGSQTTTISGVAGLTWVTTNLTELSSANVAAIAASHCGAPLPACDVTTGGASVCAGGYTGGLVCSATDFVEQVTIAVSPTFAFPGNGTVGLIVYVTEAGGTIAGPTCYFSEGFPVITAPAHAENIVLYFDIGTASSGPAGVLTVTVVAST